MKKLPLSFLALLFASISAFAFIRQQQSEDLPVDAALRKQFLAKFKKAKLPYTISASKSKADKKQGLADEFSPFVPEIASLTRGRISRMRMEDVIDDVKADVLVSSTKEYDAIIYIVERAHLQEYSFRLLTLNKAGEAISNEPLLTINRFSSEGSTVIGKDLVITTTNGDFVKKLKIDRDGSVETVN